MKNIILMMMIICSAIRLSAQNAPYTKMVLDMDGAIYFVENRFIFRLKNNVKTLIAASSAVWDERFEDEEFHLNYIVVKDKIISLYIGKGGLLIRNEKEYLSSPWGITFECVDLSMIDGRKTEGIPFFPSCLGVNIDSCLSNICYSGKHIYYDFIEYNDSVFLFLKTASQFYIFKSLMPFVDSYYIQINKPEQRISNKWELCAKFSVPDKLEFFISYVDTDNKLIISFDNNVDYRIDDKFTRMQEIKKTETTYNKNVLLQANEKYYWISDSVANALKKSNAPVSYFKSNIQNINNEK